MAQYIIIYWCANALPFDFDTLAEGRIYKKGFIFHPRLPKDYMIYLPVMDLLNHTKGSLTTNCITHVEFCYSGNENQTL